MTTAGARLAATALFLVVAIVVMPVPRAANAALDVWTSQGPEGGFIQAVAIDPFDPNTVYAASSLAFGRLFKSTNAGASWVDVGLSLGFFRISALAMDPNTRDTLYVATEGGGVYKSANGVANAELVPSGLLGENVQAIAMDPDHSDTLYAGTFSHGVFKSTNAGADWVPSNTDLPTLNVTALAVDPLASATVFAGTRTGGVFKSVNGGASWVPASDGLTITTEILKVAIDPQVPGTLYAAGLDGVFRSTNGGMTWSKVRTGLIGGVLDVAIHPTNTTTLYAGTGYGVFKTTDAGMHWSPVDTGLPDRGVIVAVTIDRTAPNILYAGTLGGGGGVFKSINGGTSWSDVNRGLVATTVQALTIDPTTPSRVYAGTFLDGVYTSTNSGTTWQATSTGLSDGDVRTLAVARTSPSTLWAGTDSFFSIGVFKSTTGGMFWSPIFGALVDSDVQVVAIDPTDANTVYAATYGEGILKTTNGGSIWNPVNDGLTGTNIRALVIDPGTPSTLYAGSYAGGVFKSTNGGLHWDPKNDRIFGSVEALAIDPTDPSILYAGGSSGVFVTVNGADSWTTHFTSGDPNPSDVRSLAIDPTNTSVVYAAGGGGVYQSTNRGTSWQFFNTGLPHVGINAMVHDPVHAGTLYVGTRRGVFGIGQALATTPTPTPTVTAPPGAPTLTANRTATATPSPSTTPTTATPTAPATPDAVATVVPAGGCCATNPSGGGATLLDPVETRVCSPNAGVCAIAERPATLPPPIGYWVLGQEIVISAPPASKVVPLTMTFVIDAAAIPSGQTAYSIRLLKNGVLVPTCIVRSGAAVPDPCLVRRRLLSGGDVELTVLTSTASIWTPVVATLDSYLCYSSTATKGSPSFVTSRGHLLDAPFESEPIDLLKPGALCRPVARDGASVTDAATSLQVSTRKAAKVCSDSGLACRKAKDCTAGATCDAPAKFATRANVVVLNGLEPVVLDVEKPTTLLAPAAVDTGGPPPAPAGAIDHFACYATKIASGACVGDATRPCTNDAACGDDGPCFTGFPKGHEVRVETAQGAKVFTLKKPTALCLPAALDGTTPMIPSVALQCYTIVAAKGRCADTATVNAGAGCRHDEDCGSLEASDRCLAQEKYVPATGLHVHASFAILRRDTKKEIELCVPSEVVAR